MDKENSQINNNDIITLSNNFVNNISPKIKNRIVGIGYNGNKIKNSYIKMKAKGKTDEEIKRSLYNSILKREGIDIKNKNIKNLDLNQLEFLLNRDESISQTSEKSNKEFEKEKKDAASSPWAIAGTFSKNALNTASFGGTDYLLGKVYDKERFKELEEANPIAATLGDIAGYAPASNVAVKGISTIGKTIAPKTTKSIANYFARGGLKSMVARNLAEAAVIDNAIDIGKQLSSTGETPTGSQIVENTLVNATRGTITEGILKGIIKGYSTIKNRSTPPAAAKLGGVKKVQKISKQSDIVQEMDNIIEGIKNGNIKQNNIEKYIKKNIGNKKDIIETIKSLNLPQNQEIDLLSLFTNPNKVSKESLNNILNFDNTLSNIQKESIPENILGGLSNKEKQSLGKIAADNEELYNILYNKKAKYNEAIKQNTLNTTKDEAKVFTENLLNNEIKLDKIEDISEKGLKIALDNNPKFTNFKNYAEQNIRNKKINENQIAQIFIDSNRFLSENARDKLLRNIDSNTFKSIPYTGNLEEMVEKNRQKLLDLLNGNIDEDSVSDLIDFKKLLNDTINYDRLSSDSTISKKLIEETAQFKKSLNNIFEEIEPKYKTINNVERELDDIIKVKENFSSIIDNKGNLTDNINNYLYDLGDDVYTIVDESNKYIKPRGKNLPSTIQNNIPNYKYKTMKRILNPNKVAAAKLGLKDSYRIATILGDKDKIIALRSAIDNNPNIKNILGISSEIFKNINSDPKLKAVKAIEDIIGYANNKNILDVDKEKLTKSLWSFVFHAPIAFFNNVWNSLQEGFYTTKTTKDLINKILKDPSPARIAKILEQADPLVRKELNYSFSMVLGKGAVKNIGNQINNEEE